MYTFAIVNDTKMSMSATDVAAMSIDEVRRELDETRAQKARLAAREIALVARLESLVSDPNAPIRVITEFELVSHGGLTMREAREAVARSRTVAIAPAIGAALSAGITTAAHVDVLSRGLKNAGPDRDAFISHLPDLTLAATTLSAVEFSDTIKKVLDASRTDDGLSRLERQRRCTHLRTWIDSDGMFHLRGQFDPVSGTAVSAVIERTKERLFHSGDAKHHVDVAPGIEPNDHLRALALVAALDTTSTTETGSGFSRAEVVVHVDLASLTHGRHPATTSRTVDGVDIPVETIRRLACEAEIIPVVLGGHGVPLDVGRSKRLATIHQRRAFEAMYTTCAIPDCDVPYHRCQIHHIDYWENGGRTDLDNQVPLCSRHHHAVHEGGWTLSLEPSTRDVTLTPP
ncbi:MAG: hypothetical protein RLZZ269_1814 [Actinomycetota bacterium]